MNHFDLSEHYTPLYYINFWFPAHIHSLSFSLNGLLEHLRILTNYFFLQTEKIELETTVVDETKGRDSYCGQGNRRFSGQLTFMLMSLFSQMIPNHIFCCPNDSFH